MYRSVLECLVTWFQFENATYPELDSVRRTNFDTGTAQEYNTVTVVSGNNTVTKTTGVKGKWLGAGLKLDQQFMLGGRNFTVEMTLIGNNATNGHLYAWVEKGAPGSNVERTGYSKATDNSTSSGFRFSGTNSSNIAISAHTNQVHIAVCYDHKIQRMHGFYNGTLKQTIAAYVSRALFSTHLRATGCFQIQEFRVYDGVALYDASFTPDLSYDKFKADKLLYACRTFLRFPYYSILDVEGNTFFVTDEGGWRSTGTFGAITMDRRLYGYLRGIFGSYDFTIEAFIYFDDTDLEDTIVNKTNLFYFKSHYDLIRLYVLEKYLGTELKANPRTDLQVDNSGEQEQEVESSTGTNDNESTETTTHKWWRIRNNTSYKIPANTDVHVAIVYKASTHTTYQFINGTLRASTTDIVWKRNCWFFSTYADIYQFNSWWKGLKVYDGLAKWTANYTPPSISTYDRSIRNEDYRVVFIPNMHNIVARGETGQSWFSDFYREDLNNNQCYASGIMWRDMNFPCSQQRAVVLTFSYTPSKVAANNTFNVDADRLKITTGATYANNVFLAGTAWKPLIVTYNKSYNPDTTATGNTTVAAGTTYNYLISIAFPHTRLYINNNIVADRNAISYLPANTQLLTLEFNLNGGHIDNIRCYEQVNLDDYSITTSFNPSLPVNSYSEGTSGAENPLYFVHKGQVICMGRKYVSFLRRDGRYVWTTTLATENDNFASVCTPATNGQVAELSKVDINLPDTGNAVGLSFGQYMEGI